MDMQHGVLARQRHHGRIEPAPGPRPEPDGQVVPTPTQRSLAVWPRIEHSKAEQVGWDTHIERDLDNERAVLDSSRSAADPLKAGLHLVSGLCNERSRLCNERSRLGEVRAMFAAGWLES
jgi:hypothetical protein